MDVMTSHTVLLNKVLAVQGVSLDNSLNHFIKAQKYLNFPRGTPSGGYWFCILDTTVMLCSLQK